MYIVVDTTRYSDVTRHMVLNTAVEYKSENLPEISDFSVVTLYEDNGYELRKDFRIQYHRFESRPGYLLLTQLPLIEYKTIIDSNRLYIGQGRVEDGVVVDPEGEGYIGVDIEAPHYRQYTEDTTGFIKPRLSMLLEWEEWATQEEIEDWEESHHRPISIEDRLDAAEAAIRALMG